MQLRKTVTALSLLAALALAMPAQADAKHRGYRGDAQRSAPGYFDRKHAQSRRGHHFRQGAKGWRTPAHARGHKSGNSRPRHYHVQPVYRPAPHAVWGYPIRGNYGFYDSYPRRSGAGISLWLDGVGFSYHDYSRR